MFFNLLKKILNFWTVNWALPSSHSSKSKQPHSGQRPFIEFWSSCQKSYRVKNGNFRSCLIDFLTFILNKAQTFTFLFNFYEFSLNFDPNLACKARWLLPRWRINSQHFHRELFGKFFDIRLDRHRKSRRPAGLGQFVPGRRRFVGHRLS